MGLVSAWVLVALTVLGALWCASGAVRLSRRPVRREREGRTR
ncbi:hypothetical protein [Goekera deserti]|nr:hypothetical protein [Goekera deserti]